MEQEPSPLIRIPTQIGDVEINWGNCVMRVFDDEQYNHLEYYEDDKTIGMRVGQEIMDVLHEHDFSYRYDKYPDPATVEWLVKMEVKLMEIDIENKQLPDM